MKKLQILNKKKIKEISSLIANQWDCQFDFSSYIVFMSPKNKIFIINQDLKKLDLDKLRINSIGLYFGEINRGSLRLSIDGSQMIGPLANKNVIELDDDLAKKWMSGEDLFLEQDYDTEFYIIKNKQEDFLGCGKVKDKKLFNYVPKERRI